MTDDTYDRDEVIRTLNLFVGPGGVTEIRILNAFGARGRNDSGYFNNFPQAAGALQQYAKSPRNPGIYFVLNPFDQNLMARASNRFQERASETTQDVDITSRRWLFIDCDPVRKTGISASDAEWNAAREKCDQVSAWLIAEHGFPAPVVASSGNGFHLHFRIDMPADQESLAIVKRCLSAIAAKFNDSAVTIDTKVCNAARICKLYGTMARKGDHTPDRPHRLSRLLDVPADLEVVSPLLLLSLADQAPAEATKPVALPQKAKQKKKKGVLSPADRARSYLAKMPGAISGQSGHDWTYHAACVLVVEFNLTIEEAFPLLQEWNETCQPPWSESELMHKLESADKLPDERGNALKSNRDRWEEEQQLRIQQIQFRLASQSPEACNQTADSVSGSIAEPAFDPIDYDRGVLREIGIVYCAETESMDIEVFSSVFRKFSVIRDPGKLTYSRLLQVAGKPALNLVSQNSMDEGKKYTLHQIKNSLAIVAGASKRGSEKLGQGIWRLNDKIVMVNGSHIGIYRDGQLTKDLSAVFEDTVFNLGDDGDWFDFDEVARWISRPERSWIAESMHELCDILGQWCFKIPDRHECPSVCSEILASLIVASWIQSFWMFRPMVFLLGESNCGKSTLMQLLTGEESNPLDKGLMGALAIHSANQSAAGIRQAAEHSSRPVFVDEFEKGKHRSEILELLRGASRGSQSLRGTAGQKAVTTKVAFMAWAASTESGLVKQVDQNRWIQIQMVAPTSDKMGKLRLPDLETLASLQSRLVAASVVIGNDARTMVDSLMARRPKDIDHRICQIFSVPAAVFACMTGIPEASAGGTLNRFLKVFDMNSLERDQDVTLDTVLTSKVRIGTQERTVLSLLESLDGNRDPLSAQYEETLAANGIRILWESHFDAIRKVFFHCPSVSRHLIKDTQLAGVKLDELLMRVNGAERSNRRINGKSMKGVLVPLKVIVQQDQELDLFSEV